MYKMIAIDIDGTLLDSKRQISKEVKRAIALAKRKGVKVVLCSGRPLVGVREYLKALNLVEEGDYAITFNGALIQDTFTGQPLSHLTLRGDEIKELLAVAKNLGLSSHFLDLENLLTVDESVSPYSLREVEITRTPLKQVTPSEILGAGLFSKFMLSDHPENIGTALTRLPSDLLRRFTVIRS